MLPLAHKSSKELARELRVDTIVAGRLTQAVHRLTCHIEVVDAEGRQLGGRQFTPRSPRSGSTRHCGGPRCPRPRASPDRPELACGGTRTDEALARNPNDVDACDLFARGLRQRERFDESIAAARREVRLDPLSAIAHDNLAISLYQARQSSDETLSEARAALELDPSDTLMKRTLAAVYELRGEHGEAVAARQRFERLRGTRRSLKAAARFGRLLNEILVADRHASAR